MHQNKFEYAGKKIPVADKFIHHQYPHIKEIVIEDWWDRITGKSWMENRNNSAVMMYLIRINQPGYQIPVDDEVLYGHYKGSGILIHISELNLKRIGVNDDSKNQKKTS